MDFENLGAPFRLKVDRIDPCLLIRGRRHITILEHRYIGRRIDDDHLD